MVGRAVAVGAAATAVARAAMPVAAEVLDQGAVVEGTVVEAAEAAIVRCYIG